MCINPDERKAHENWATLIRENPKAAELLHLLVANMDKRGAVVISQKVLAELMGVHRNTIGKAIKSLTKDNWIEALRIGSEKGGVKAYLINNRVAWADKRDNQRFAAFSARVIVSSDEQDQTILESKQPLRQLPRLGETQLPVGEGEDPPSQPSLPEMEPDLPATDSDEERQEKFPGFPPL